jgi:ureidoglycolate amidohydrolase
MIVTVDEARLADEIETLARISDDVYPSVTRVLFTDADMRARAWLVERCTEAGLTTRFDAVGNLFARWEGTDPAATPIATGSHIDAIPQSGRFDGVVGVLGGLEAIRALQAAGVRLRRSVDLIMFTAEEPTRFGIGCLGSRLLAGALSDERLDALRDADGLTLDQARASAGYADPLATVRLPQGDYAAFVELHIEQGPHLDAGRVAIGAVEAIAAPATLALALSGPGGHAGAVLMSERHDPMVAAAEVILAVNAAARSTGAPDTVATCGLVTVKPGAVNSIPREVSLEIDVRDIDGARRDMVLAEIREAASQAALRAGVDLEARVLNADPPATCDPAVVAAVTAACEDHEIVPNLMVSRAYHDSLFMARICPTGMIFIPCRDGVSHRPDEYSSPEHMAKGAAVLAGTLARLGV